MCLKVNSKSCPKMHTEPRVYAVPQFYLNIAECFKLVLSYRVEGFIKTNFSANYLEIFITQPASFSREEPDMQGISSPYYTCI